jgi:hypothetical protein
VRREARRIDGTKIPKAIESMVVTHILMYRFKDGVPDARVDEHLAFIEGLRGKFEGLIDLKCGRDIGTGNRKFTHGFVMKFESPEALAAYNKADLHRELVETFRDDVEDKVVFDSVMS